jgi:hypothetical protein
MLVVGSEQSATLRKRKQAQAGGRAWQVVIGRKRGERRAASREQEGSRSLLVDRVGRRSLGFLWLFWLLWLLFLLRARRRPGLTLKNTLSHAFPPVAEQRRRERQDTGRWGGLVQPPLSQNPTERCFTLGRAVWREREKTPEKPLIVREGAFRETRQGGVSLAVEPFGEREKRRLKDP